MKRVLCFILSIILIMTSTIIIVPSETLATETVIKNYDYIGDVQTFTAPHTGTYTLEVWGAQGGIVYNTYEGGKGGYAKGTLTLNRGDILYILVGGQGTKTAKGYGSSMKGTVYGGYNGGGAGYVHSSGDSYCSAGGGATDIRINQNSLYARVIVAGGGSGRGYAWDDGSVVGVAYAGGGETSDGYSGPPDFRAGQTKGNYGSVFGVGADALNRNSSKEYVCSSPGAGGGWYGGVASMSADFVSNNTLSATAGGSGYVYTSSSASNYPSGCLLNSSYYMTDTQNIVGSSSFPSTSGGTETGHSGNGYARITYEKIEQKILDEDVVLGFDYTGNVQTFVAPQNGTYTLEVWGASGGNFTMLGETDKYTGGKGGYAKGTVTLQKGDILYIQVGGRGADAVPVGWSYDNYKSDPIENAGGYNGGGKAYSLYYSYGDGSYTPNINAGGGGGTDIRINQNSLYARVIVAGGGSGSNQQNNGYAGGGETSKGYSSAYYATQTSAGTNGSFGQGGSSSTQENESPGGGGGWYGGGSSSSVKMATGGGSGYTYTSSSASNYPSGCLLNSTYYMIDTQNINGATSLPSLSGSTETGHSGNGYARISYTQILDETPPIVTFSVNGTTTYVAKASTVVTVEDDSGLGTLMYLWTASNAAPSKSTFMSTFTNGKTLTLSGQNGTWYLWIYAEDTYGNSTIERSNAFLLDGIAPEGEIKIASVVYEEDGMKFTNSNNLKINITNVSDNITSEANMKIALINENNFSLTNPNSEIEWIDYTSTINWQASNGDGLKRVYVIFKDEAGNQSLYLAT